MSALEPTMSVTEMAAYLGFGKALVYAGCKAEGPDRWPHFRSSDSIRAKIRFTVAHRDQIVRMLHTAQQPAGPAEDDFDDLLAAYKRQTAPRPSRKRLARTA